MTNSILWDRWREHAERSPEKAAIVHWKAGEDPVRWTWGRLWSEAHRYARLLSNHGVRAGDVCALVIRHHPRFYPLYMGISALGAVPAVLAYPNPRLHPAKFREGLQGMARRSGLTWLLTEAELDPVVRPLAGAQGSTIQGVLFAFEWPEGGADEGAQPRMERPGVLPEDPCLLQHSSGTTGLQKAVVLSHRAVLEHVARYGEAIALSREDKVVSWLPLYHDMGLIAAFHLPLAFGIPAVQLDPFEWVLAPEILLEVLSAEKGTLSWLPNFAYNLLATRVRAGDFENIRLDSVRMLINCSEPVRWESHDRFHRRFAAAGLKRESLAACYAMAETTFAVTQTPPGTEAPSLSVDREDLARGTVCITDDPARARICVSSGAPISGCGLRIVGEQGEDLPDDRVGEIAIRSVSLFDGYRNNAEKTKEVFRDGWYLSGDLGFRRANHYFVVGRKKDIIIVAGKNVYPEDVEDAVSQVPGVVPGRVVAFGVFDVELGTERVGVVAETEMADEGEKKQLRLAIQEAGMQMDIHIEQVYLAAPRWLIKSSAGKLSRKANHERALRELRPV
jgi:acyl-CoA synthetase (AMP-forming)/AMP-acid ligase II